jgi:hypothetical protein
MHVVGCNRRQRPVLEAGRAEWAGVDHPHGQVLCQTVLEQFDDVLFAQSAGPGDQDADTTSVGDPVQGLHIRTEKELGQSLVGSIVDALAHKCFHIAVDGVGAGQVDDHYKLLAERSRGYGLCPLTMKPVIDVKNLPDRLRSESSASQASASARGTTPVWTA